MTPPAPAALPTHPPAEAHPRELPPRRDAADQWPQEQQRPADSGAAGEQGTERTERSGHGGHPGQSGHGDRRGPQLVPSATTTGPLSPAERRFEGRPPTDHRQPFQPAGHAGEPAAPDAEGPGHGHGHGHSNGTSGPAIDSRGTPERNGTFVVTERMPRYDDEGDEAESDLRELPRRDVRGDVGPLIDALRAVFENDRSVASQGGNARCGICYLHYPLSELEYRTEEGYYVCLACKQRLGSTRLPMIRRQQR